MAGSSGGHGASMKSWLVSFVILAGVILGGVALVIWNWPLFWISVAVVVIGIAAAWAVGIMNDVMEYGGQQGTDPSSQTTG